MTVSPAHSVSDSPPYARGKIVPIDLSQSNGARFL